MLKIAVLGIAGILLALLLKEVMPQFAVYISMAVCIMIFFFSINKLSYLKDSMESLLGYIRLKESYLISMLKIMGITYVADFSSHLCKDAGYGAIAGQIEFFGKISILSVSMPIIWALLETINGFLV